MTSPVLQVFELGTQWPTLDPFLFCAHHVDDYPAGRADLGPAASLDDRPLGSDFGGIDGWNMYHGSQVPGFPQHPHRGFETVTYVRTGWCDHSDSLGARARFGQGDVQWLTAGSGIVHSEMFPLLNADHDNPLHLFQIWLNLSAANKMIDPYYSMLWGSDIPTFEAAPGVEVTVLAGRVDGHRAPTPPPHSWAATTDSDIGIWHIKLDAAGAWTLPPASSADSNRVLYFFQGEQLDVGGDRLDASSGAVLDAHTAVAIEAPSGPAECLIMQGVPLGEPVAKYGPFVMNTEAEIEQAFRDYQTTGFGGWPWADDGPTHGSRPERFEERPTDQDNSEDPATTSTR